MSVRLRPLAPRDAVALAELHARVHRASAWRSAAAYASYALEILFRNPWVDRELPSWAAEENGRMVGFLGVVPRRMRCGSRTLRVAVSCQLMIDPQKRSSLIALELLRRLFAGPQDLTVADGANDASRALWEACGGISSAMHSLHWVWLLRPAQGLLELAPRGLRPLCALAKPLAALADACIGSPFKAQYREAPLEPEALCRAMREQRAFAPRPDYDPASLDWLLAQARAKRRHGELQGALVHDAGGRTLGWFLYYLNNAVSQVLQIGARRGCLGTALDSLGQHARTRGARALEGRLEPHLGAGLRGRRVIVRTGSVFTLLHARDPQLLVPFLRGDAFFSRLDGEWWMRFAEGETGSERVSANRAPVAAKAAPAALRH